MTGSDYEKNSTTLPGAVAMGTGVMILKKACGPTTVTGLPPSPIVAAAAMGLSSVFVITNALRLGRADLWPASTQMQP